MKKLHATAVAMGMAGILGLSLASAMTPANPGPPAFQDGQDVERQFERFKRRFDKNLDGKISEAEFTRGKRAFRRLDADRDGFLTKDEFVSARGGKSKEPAKPEAKPAQPMTAGSEMPDAKQLEFFEKNVRPVLANNCYRCHSNGSKRLKGGLKLDSLEGLLQGGDYGPVLVPGDTEASTFIEAIRYADPDMAMPPKEKLSDQEIEDLEQWVRMGAPWAPEQDMGSVEVTPESFGEEKEQENLNRHIDIEAGREFWSFQVPVRPTPPTTKDQDWGRSPIDQFLLARMEEAELSPMDDADDRTWLRRVTFDLTGLPPTPQEVTAFLADRSKDRDAKVVDRLLDSPGYAERWGRHWLDVARYAESSGKEQNVVYPHAWRYRDWVLRAFAQDMPYNRFLKLQLAGDLAPVSDGTEKAWNQIATGYLAIGPKGHANRNRTEFELDMVDEQIDAMSQGMLALTVSCARCHDHKFDPIPTADYYSLAGIFYSTTTHFGTIRAPGNNQASDLIQLPEATSLPNGPDMDSALVRFLERGARRQRPGGDQTPAMDEMEMSEEDKREQERRAAQLARRSNQQEALRKDLQSRFDSQGKALPSNRLAMGVSEGEPRDIAILKRGELDQPGGVVRRNVPQVLRPEHMPAIGDGSGRAELADWISSADNPLTARVWANRVWLHLFGAGIVSTPDNFGAAGQRPTHPELLDWLATELVAKGWSTKALIREITLSRAYRLTSRTDKRAHSIDPDVRLLWRMPKKRLESEALRDAMLAISGKLSPHAPVGSATGTFEGSLRNEQVADLMLREQSVRSVYLPNPRGFTMETLAAFDAPDSEFVTGDRDETTVATQALFLMNDAEVLRLADAFADRLLAMEGKDSSRIQAAFELAYGREPTSSEKSAVKTFLRSYASEAEKAMEKQAKEEAKQGNAKKRARQRARTRARNDQAPAPHTDPRRAAWSSLAQTLFQGAEFRILN